MVLLPLQDLRRDEHGEVGVFDAEFLDLRVEPACMSMSIDWGRGRLLRTLDRFPDSIRPWLQDVAPADAVIVQHVCFDEDLVRKVLNTLYRLNAGPYVGVPRRKINLLLDADGDLDGALDLGIFLLFGGGF